MISTAARASAAHTQPDSPDDELVGATAAVDTGTVLDCPTDDVPPDAADVGPAVGVLAADDAAGAGAPVNWNFTSPVTGWPSADTTR